MNKLNKAFTNRLKKALYFCNNSPKVPLIFKSKNYFQKLTNLSKKNICFEARFMSHKARSEIG